MCPSHRYWDFPYEQRESRNGCEGDYLEELRALLDEAVKIMLVADVPLGAFLSGGVDSTTIVGLMSRHIAQPVKTFSIGFREDSYNELPYARLAASQFGTEHHELIVTPDVHEIVDDLVWHFDEPFADVSAIPTYLVAKLAREHVKVALSGDGGDELFGGYTRYATHLRRGTSSSIPRFLREGVIQPLSRSLPHGAWGRNYLHNITLDPFSRYLDSISVFTDLNKQSLYASNFVDELDAVGRVRPSIAGSPITEPLDSLMYFDSKTYLPGDILTKVDRMTMAVSLESRAPFLDHKLIEFVTRIPPGMKLHGSNAKHILKMAAADLLPSEIRNRPKQGFGVPIDSWINNELHDRIRDTLRDSATRQRGYFESRYVDTLLDEHARGRRDHSRALWSLFMLELWYRRFATPTGAPPRHRSVDPTPLRTGASSGR